VESPMMNSVGAAVRSCALVRRRRIVLRFMVVELEVRAVAGHSQESSNPHYW
jgi:hypothetical protein